MERVRFLDPHEEQDVVVRAVKSEHTATGAEVGGAGGGGPAAVPLPIIAFPHAAGAMACAMSMPERFAMQFGAALVVELEVVVESSLHLF